MPKKKYDWHAKFLDECFNTLSCVRAMEPIAEEIGQRISDDLDSYNPDYHVEITLTAAECKKIVELVKKLKPAKEAA